MPAIRGYSFPPSPRLWFYRRDTAVVKLLTGFSVFSPVFARGGATRGPLHPLRGCPRAWALEWERWISPVVIWGLEYCRLLALGLGWLEALQWRPPTFPTQFSRSAFGFGNLVPFESSLRWCALFWICGPRLLNVATGGVWDLFVLLPKILGCRGFFARAFLLGRLDIFTRKSPRSWLQRDLSEKRALSARRLFFVDGGSIN